MFTSYLKETVAGLDIGEDYISAATVSSRGNGRIEVDKITCLDIKPGLSDMALSLALKRLWRSCGMHSHTVYSCLRSPSLTLKYFSYPHISDKELSSTLRLEAEHTFNRPIDELNIDWYLYPNPKGAAGDKEGILVMVPKEDIDRHMAILSKAGLYPAGISVGWMASAGLFLRSRKGATEETVCLVDANTYSLDMSVCPPSLEIYPRFVYSKPLSLRDRADYIIENIEDLLRYYQFKLHRKPAGRIVFTGRLSAEEAFRKKMQKAFTMPIDFWDPLDDAVMKRPILKRARPFAPVYAASLALAGQEA